MDANSLLVRIFTQRLYMTIDLQDLFPEVKKMDEKSIFALFKALKKKFDPATFEYMKFKQSVATLSKMEMDQSTSYKSAFATAQTMGLTKATLLRSAKNYHQVLEDERESFATALLQQKSIRVDGRKEEVTELARKIEDHKNKIKQLESEIKIFQQRIDNVDQDVEIASDKLEGTKKKFLDVYKILTESINKDIESINLYL